MLLGAQTGTGQPFTLPHIRVDLSTGGCEERENICPRAEDIARLNEVRPWPHSTERCRLVAPCGKAFAPEQLLPSSSRYSFLDLPYSMVAFSGCTCQSFAPEQVLHSYPSRCQLPRTEYADELNCAPDAGTTPQHTSNPN